MIFETFEMAKLIQGWQLLGHSLNQGPNLTWFIISN